MNGNGTKIDPALMKALGVIIAERTKQPEPSFVKFSMEKTRSEDIAALAAAVEKLANAVQEQNAASSQLLSETLASLAKRDAVIESLVEKLGNLKIEIPKIDIPEIKIPERKKRVIEATHADGSKTTFKEA